MLETRKFVIQETLYSCALLFVSASSGSCLSASATGGRVRRPPRRHERLKSRETGCFRGEPNKMPHDLTESGAFSCRFIMNPYCQIEYVSSDSDVGTL